MLFDYVRIRFPTTDVKHIVEDVLRLKLPYFIHEDYGFYSYTEHYYLGDIFVLVSPELEKGVLLELKGRGCRQFESYLLAQERSWYEFFMDVLMEDGVMKLPDRQAFAGSVATMDRLVRNMVHLAGVPLWDAVAMATATPARVIGLADRKGSLAPGFDADIVLMDKQLNVKAVMARGQFVE